MTYRDDFRSAYDPIRREVFWTAGKVIALIVILAVCGVALSAVLGALGFFTGAVDNAAQVAKKEFYPDALLRKYEWFKDAHAALNAKLADVKIYETKLRPYEAVPLERRSRQVQESVSVWEQELAGLKASYNNLAAEYNAQMAKFNWRFTNAGDLPPGANEPLPRSHAPYTER